VTGLEFHQHINVAVRAEVVAEYRSEQRQSRDTVPLAERPDGTAVDDQVRAHDRSMIPPPRGMCGPLCTRPDWRHAMQWSPCPSAVADAEANCWRSRWSQSSSGKTTGSSPIWSGRVAAQAAPLSDDDPIIQAIKKAIEQAGATS